MPRAIPSCRCKNFSLKVVSVRSDGGGPDPPDPSPGSATVPSSAFFTS